MTRFDQHRLSRFIAAGMLVTVIGSFSGCHRKAEPPPQHAVAALLTDYGLRDPSVAEMKGAMLTVNPRLHVVDLTHEIEPFNTNEAAYILNQSAREFPAGTVFLVVVSQNQDQEVAKMPLLVMTEADKYYIAPDNGVLTLVLQREKFVKGWRLDKSEYYRKKGISTAFYGRDIVGPVGAHLLSGVEPDKLGTPVKRSDIDTLTISSASTAGPNTSGEIWHIDNFGNIVTNISNDEGSTLKEGSLLKATVGGQTVSGPLVKNFRELPKGRLGFLFSSQGLLEICVSQGSAAKQLNVKVGNPVIIRQ
jgi:S-adenosyl-L-methionine hydrolase (adenosine-forming)